MDRLDPAAIVVPGVQVRVLGRCTSTNSVLLKAPCTGPVLLAAEEQTAGRGRRGRRWRSAPGVGLTFSLSRSLQRPVREVAGLSLVAGVERRSEEHMSELQSRGHLVCRLLLEKKK